jgi:hypothetical protein
VTTIEVLADEAGEAGADKGPRPVRSVVAPAARAHDRRPERACRVHHRAVERAAGQHVGAGQEPHGERRHRPGVAPPRVHRRRVVGVHEPERHGGVQHHRVPAGHAPGQRVLGQTLQQQAYVWAVSIQIS